MDTLLHAATWILACAALTCGQGVPASDLFVGGGKVVILHPEQSFNITYIKAMLVYIKNLNPVYVQMWRRNTETNYTLEWQVILKAMPIFGRNLVNLKEDDMFMVSSDHRLGVYNVRDPGPIPYQVTDQGSAVISEISFNTQDPLVLGGSYSFNTLPFPYTFGLQLCNYTDCSDSSPTTPVMMGSSTMQGVKPTPVVILPEPGGTEHPLMSGTFLVVLLVWLIVLTFIVITVIIVVIYLNARNSGAIVRAGEDKSSNADPEGDWYIVVQDTAQAQNVLSS